MFRIIDRYVVREILPPTLLALLVFTFMLMMGPIDRVAQALLAKGVAVPVIGRMLLLLVPQALAVTIPMAFLLGLLVAFGRLSGDSEWTAMQACGVNLAKLLQPVLALGLVCWAATQWVLVVAVPWCNQSFRELEYGVVAARVESEIKPRVFFEDFPGLVLYARDVAQGVPGWIDVFVAETGQPGPPVVSVARHGRMLIDREHRKIEMVLEDGISHKLGTDATGQDRYDANSFQSLIRDLDPKQVFPQDRPQKGEAEMTVAELRKMAAELRREGRPADRPEIYIHQKFSIPVACLVFAFMGLGLGVSTSRGGKLAAFALGTGVIFAYYVVMYAGRAMSIGGLMPGWLAAWLPNIVLGPLALLIVVGRTRSSGRGLRFSLPSAARPNDENDRPAVAHSPAGQAAARVILVVKVPQLGLPRPGILDRYLSKMYLRVQALTFVSLLGIFYISTFIDLSDKLFKGKTTADVMLRYFYFQTPQFIYYVLPISVLLASLVTIGAITRSSELVVMKACGISLYRIAVPLLAFGAAASVLLFALEEHLLAHSNRQAQELEHLIRIGTVRSSGMLNRRWVVGRNGEIYHYLFFDARRAELRELSKFEFDRKTWRLSRVTYVSAARFVPSSAVADGSVGTWIADRGSVRELDARGDPRTFSAFTHRSLTMEPPDYFGTEQPEADRMTYGELRQYIEEMRSAGLNVVQPLVGLHRKLSFPFVTIIMTLLAVPFAVTTGRRGALYGVGVGIVLALVYWTANNMFGVVGVAGMISPALAAWAPNLLFGASAAYLLLTVRT